MAGSFFATLDTRRTMRGDRTGGWPDAVAVAQLPQFGLRQGAKDEDVSLIAVDGG